MKQFACVQASAAALGELWMRTILEQNDVDILVTGMKYAGNAAGVPPLTIPNGLDPNGQPQGIVLSGPYLSDPQLIAVGWTEDTGIRYWFGLAHACLAAARSCGWCAAICDESTLARGGSTIGCTKIGSTFSHPISRSSYVSGPVL